MLENWFCLTSFRNPNYFAWRRHFLYGNRKRYSWKTVCFTNL